MSQPGTEMNITVAEDRNPGLIEQLTEVWESSVRATHLFLSQAEIEDIKQYIPQALREVPRLYVLEDEGGAPAAFMGTDGTKLEMLFVSSGKRGKGLGKRLVLYGMEHDSVREVGVNEQNPQARGFYEHMGFHVYKRTETDEQGNPYPILYMKLD